MLKLCMHRGVSDVTQYSGTLLKQTSGDPQNILVLSVSMNIIIDDCTFTNNDIMADFESTKPNRAAPEISSNNLPKPSKCLLELVCSIQIVHTCIANSVHSRVESIPKYSISTPKSTQKHTTLIYDTDWSRTTIIKDILSCSNLNLVAMYPYKIPVTLLTVCNHPETRR